MNEVSIIINGVRYDAEKGTRCLQCDLFKGICNIYSSTHRVEPLASCPLKDGYIFKKSDKKYEQDSNGKYKITGLDNGYLIEIEAEGEFRKFCCKIRDEVKEFVYEYWLDEVDACGYVEVEAKIKVGKLRKL